LELGTTDALPDTVILAVDRTAWTPTGWGGTSDTINVTDAFGCQDVGYLGYLIVTIKPSATWLTIRWSSLEDGDTGTTPAHFTIHANPNTTSSARTGTVTVTGRTAPGVVLVGSPKTITVTQQPAIWILKPKLGVGISSWTVASAGGSKSIEVTNTGSQETLAYSVKSNAPAWLMVSDTTGATPGDFTITTAANSTNLTRTGRVTVSALLPSGVIDSIKTITVTQRPGYVLTTSVASWSASAQGGTKIVRVTNTGDGGAIRYSISKSAAWLTVSPTSDSTPGTFTIKAAGNTTLLTRTGKVTVTAMSPSRVNGSPKTVLVTQVGRLMKASSESDDETVETAPLPTEYALHPNYPNPFNPSTTIVYDLPVDGFMKLEVFDGLGHRVSTLVDGYQAAGEYSAVFDAKGLPSGVYCCRLSTSGNAVLTRKLLLVR
jgi:hypothetical protein